jgi:hypothetical protein
MSILRPSPPYEERRERVVVQVVERWMGEVSEQTTAEAELYAKVAANATYHPKINDLDWEAATLRRLGYEGLTL